MRKKKNIKWAGIERTMPPNLRRTKCHFHYTAVNARPTLEDLIEAERQRNEIAERKSVICYKDNGEPLTLVVIYKGELLMAKYRLPQGRGTSINDGDQARYYAIRDSQGLITLDGKAVFCLKGTRGRRKLQELVDKGFFNSPRLQHKDSL